MKDRHRLAVLPIYHAYSPRPFRRAQDTQNQSAAPRVVGPGQGSKLRSIFGEISTATVADLVILWFMDG